ncbi:acetyl-CoA carboxylase biotin carboxyl carrier protein [uncultured Hyphomonas sp.]|jgi:acetyl-CoA carboxylase biotin carboxyl carrier protein|uniref:acetyl-CoA carboxylase biotin carboxyl carrier protein n=1 Tax=uncultured Hyphomonas sp. TaxID=225298 RepID=UPI000C57CC0E|nr:acetyl-CoA carboxylase, biotin carboxyl carrier protein [Hyphomonadaceae bacterium]MBA27917.1 acetyl-CoA carboxylase, biotin carboxyl carrier protein [Hyphomonadaceae bacterium]|tara:strand:+ start:1650 stop:2117 length:468 start_codon:yes stop_codon:yes gene_type:complete
MSTTKNKLDTGLVRELAAILREADLGEVEVEHEGLRIRVSKPAAPVVQAAMAAPAAAPVAAAPAAAPIADAVAAPAASDKAIKSPMVGTVYLSPEPGAKQFVAVGDKVKKGDTVLLVEAMKTFNPVEADKAGIVKEIYVSDSQPVEYGEALILIE